MMRKLLAGCMLLLCIVGCEKEPNDKKPSTVSFENMRVNVIYNDANENLWVGTSNGLYKHLSDQWYDYSSEISGKEVLDIITYAGSVWVGTREGLLKTQLDGHNLTIEETYNPTNSCMESSQVNALGVSPDDKLWAGTENGICYYDEDQWENIMVEEMAGINVSSLAFDQMEYFIGTYGDYLYHYYVQDIDGSSGASYLIPPFNGELSTDTVFCTSMDKEGNLWFGSSKGLTKNKNGTHVMNGSFTYYLQGIDVFDLHITDKIYAGTGNGLHIYDGNVWEHFMKTDGLPNDSIIAVCTASNGDIWVGTTNGLAKIANGSIQSY